MTKQPGIWIALLRGIGGATHKAMPMAALRGACEKAGFSGVQTVLATGNVIFRTTLPAPDIKQTLEDIIAGSGLRNEVFLRRPADMIAAQQANPFLDAATLRPSHLLIHFLDRAIPPDALADYDGPERFAAVPRAFFIDYGKGVGASRLTPARLKRELGQSGTARNWNTLAKLIAEAV